MARRSIGIEIGSDTVKLAVCSGKAVKTMAVERMPENFVRDSRITAPATMASFLKDMCHAYGIRPGSCALVLPQTEVIAQRITMPAMNEKELRLNLPFEFRAFVGRDSKKYEYDYILEELQATHIQLYSAAVRKDILDEYDSVLRKAGFTLKAAMPVEMAWSNLLRHTQEREASICIVDIGHSITRVNFFFNGRYEMGKRIAFAGRAITQAIASAWSIDPFLARSYKENNMDNLLSSAACTDVYEAIASEILRAIHFYCERKGECSRIYYCGGSAGIDALCDAIHRYTALPIFHIKQLLPNVSFMDENTIACCALASGAAMQLP